MSGVSPGGVAENGTRSGKGSCDLLFMRLDFTNLLSCLPSLAAGLVPAGPHYYGGSDSCQPLHPILRDRRFRSTASAIVLAAAWNIHPAAFLTALAIEGSSTFCSGQVSLLISIELPNIPSPTTLLPFHSPQFDTLPGSVTVQVVPPAVRRGGLTCLGHLRAVAWDQGFARC